MARPRKEGMDYFPHDTDASNDEKIEALRAMYGNDGYAFYFILLERIYRTPGAELDLSRQPIKAALINKMMLTPERFEEMLQTAFDIKCFDEEVYREKLILTSNGIKRRAEEVNGLRERWRNKKKKGTASPVFQGENPEETGERKENKSKVNINSSSSIADAIDFFGENIHLMPTPFEIDEIKQWANQMSPEVILEAMKEAVLNGKKTMSYINGILRNWHTAGITTMEALEAHRRDRENGQPPRNAGTNKKQVEPKPIIDRTKFGYQG